MEWLYWKIIVCHDTAVYGRHKTVECIHTKNAPKTHTHKFQRSLMTSQYEQRDSLNKNDKNFHASKSTPKAVHKWTFICHTRWRNECFSESYKTHITYIKVHLEPKCGYVAEEKNSNKTWQISSKIQVRCCKIIPTYDNSIFSSILCLLACIFIRHCIRPKNKERPKHYW